MSNQLPPSKFGAGTTYGETGQAHALPKTAPPPPTTPPPPPVTPPPYSPAPDQYSMTGYGTPIDAAPYAATSQPPQTPYPYAPHATPSTNDPVHTPAGGAGAAAPVTAAILCLIGAVWYGMDMLLNWDRVEFLFLILDGSPTVWQYGLVATVFMQCAFTILLLIGGILLLTRNSVGRVLALLGTVLVVVANIVWTVSTFDFANSMDAMADRLATSSPVRDDLVVSVLLHTGLPTLLAVITFGLLLSGSTARWCRRTALY